MKTVEEILIWLIIIILISFLIGLVGSIINEGLLLNYLARLKTEVINFIQFSICWIFGYYVGYYTLDAAFEKQTKKLINKFYKKLTESSQKFLIFCSKDEIFESELQSLLLDLNLHTHNKL